jgi:hypothetical protein
VLSKSGMPSLVSTACRKTEDGEGEVPVFQGAKVDPEFAPSHLAIGESDSDGDLFTEVHAL